MKEKLPEEAGGDEVAGAPPPSVGARWGRRILGGFLALVFLAIAIPNYLAATRHPSHRACAANMKIINGALELWLLDHGIEELPRLAADPQHLLERDGYLQQWPAHCPGHPGAPYHLRSRGPNHPPEAACPRHGNIEEFSRSGRRGSDLF